MRIAYVLTSLGVGGAERLVVQAAERMAARGHCVMLLVLLAPQPQQWPTELETSFLSMRKSLWSGLTGVLRGRCILQAFHPDVVHSHTFPANFFARMLRVSLPGVRVVSTLHNVYEGGLLRRIAYRITSPLSAATTAVSQDVAERAIANRSVRRNACVVIANGIDVAEFTPNAMRRGEMRRSEQIGNVFLWMTAGRLAPAKDHPNLLRAFALLYKALPESRLWIAGEGNPEYVGFLQRLAAELGIGREVRWLGLRRDLPALLDVADGFVLASSWEGMPLVVGEAMAMEKPVVATDVGGVREWLGEGGVIVPAGQSETLFLAMRELQLCPAASRAEEGRRARQRVVARYSVERMVDQWEQLYRRLPGITKKQING